MFDVLRNPRRRWPSGRIMSLLALILLAFPLGPLIADEKPSDQAAEAAEAPEEAREVASSRNDQGRVRVTGSRIPQDADRVMRNGRLLTAYPVTVYTREQIQQTGAVDLADALRRMDPRFH